MNLIKEILHIQNYYCHPFKEICKNELIINTATNINYSVSREMAPMYTLGSLGSRSVISPKRNIFSFSFFVPILDESLKVINEHKDIVIIINRNEITRHEVYLFLKNVKINAMSDYTLEDKSRGLMYIEGESTDIIMSHNE